MPDKTIIDEWISKADEDFFFAQKYVVDEDTFFAQLCFHCHQAVEKYLKGYLLSRGDKNRKIHDLKELLDHCAKKDISFEALRQGIDFLRPFYIDTRYPVAWPTGYTREDTERALMIVKEVRNLIKERLPK